MTNEVKTQLTTQGIAFIRRVCATENQNNRLLRGKAAQNIGGNFPLSNTSPAIDSNYEWVCRPRLSYESNQIITTGAQLAEALIVWFNALGLKYKVDANIMAAQAYAESKYQLWSYSKAAMGISQFTMETIYDVLVNNLGKPLNSNDILYRDIITSGLTNPLSITSYQPKKENNPTPSQNKATLHQRLCDNPLILLDAQFKYMRWIADKTNNLASSTLFCYNRGFNYARPTYSATIESCIKKNKEGGKYHEEGVDYVLRIFIILGDKNNVVNFGKKPKKINEYFGYDHLFKYTKFKNQELNQLLFKNTNFDTFDANIQESKLLGINMGNEDDFVVRELSKNPNYKFIYFPEQNYNRTPIVEKKQIVLHHTISGDDPRGNINHWLDHYSKKGERVSTAFIINRSGDIYQLFLTDYWGLHIGAGTPYDSRGLHQRSIGIELSSYGGLTKKNGQWYSVYNDLIPRENVVEYPDGFHGFYAFEKYTQEQIDSLEQVLLVLKKAHPDVDFNYTENMFGIYNPQTKQYELSTDALNGVSGIWSHTAYRLDKSDIHPQNEIINMLKGLINKIPVA